MTDADRLQHLTGFSRQYEFDRVDEWRDEKPSRVPRPVRWLLGIAIVAILIGGSVLVIAHYNKPGVEQLYLGADEVHITDCSTVGSVTADLVNPTGSTADLNATVEVDDPAHSSNTLGTVTLVAENVRGHGSIAATGSGPFGVVSNPARVTCHVTGIETVPLSR